MGGATTPPTAAPARAQYVWGLLTDHGVTVDLISQWRATAETDVADARCLSWVLTTGGDTVEGRNIMRRAARTGDLHALNWVMAQPGAAGWLDGRRHARAVREDRAAAEAGAPDSAYRLALTLWTTHERIRYRLDVVDRALWGYHTSMEHNPALEIESDSLDEQVGVLARHVRKYIDIAVAADHGEAIAWRGGRMFLPHPLRPTFGHARYPGQRRTRSVASADPGRRSWRRRRHTAAGHGAGRDR